MNMSEMALSKPGPQIGVIAVVPRRDEVLLVRRLNPPDAGLWGFPGGKLEWGETIREGAERELFEETSIRGRAGAILTTLDVMGRHSDGSLEHHFVLVAVLCELLGGEAHAADDAAEAAWFAISELGDADPHLSVGVAMVARLGLAHVLAEP